MKNQKKMGGGGLRCSYKDVGGRRVVHIAGLSIERGQSKHCFLLITYGLSSSNALYSVSLSFRMFIFLLTPVDTFLLFQIKSEPGVAYKSIVKKPCNNVFLVF